MLIVDEDAAGRSLLEMRLQLTDFDVTCARHGRAALQLLALGIYPCVMLVDVVKPSVGGSELRRALLYGEEFHRIAVQALPPLDGHGGLESGVAEIVGGVLGVADRACPHVAVFRRAPREQRAVVHGVRPPRIRRPLSP